MGHNMQNNLKSSLLGSFSPLQFSPERDWDKSMVCNVWVLDLVQERFHDTCPADFKSMFIKAGDIEIKSGLNIEEAR